MPSFNHVTIAGNLTRDPDLRYVGRGTPKPVVKINVAVNRVHARREAGQKMEADYFDCVGWNKLAETINTYLKTGSGVLVHGHLRTRSYEAKEGGKRYVTEIVIDEMQMLDKRPSGASSEPDTYRAGEGGGGYDDSALDEEEIPF